MTRALVGINIGTSKIVAVSALFGAKSVTAEVDLPRQDAAAWIGTLQEVLGRIGAPHPGGLVGVCGTSGTFVLTDDRGSVLGPPVMYNDSQPQAAGEVRDRLAGTRWAASGVSAADHPLVKLFHALKSLSPAGRSRLRWLVPQSVWLSYSLTKETRDIWDDVSADVSNCRKLEGRLEDPQWPEELCSLLSIPKEILPRVVPSGAILGDVRGPIAQRWGMTGGTLFQGTTDANAEAMALIGDRVGQIGIMAGSTTSIKAVVPQSMEVGSYAYLAPHPTRGDRSFYTAWVSVGENLRRRANIEGLSVDKLIDAAWHLGDDAEVPAVTLRRVPVTDEWSGLPAALFARGVMESAAWWEALQIEAIDRALHSSTSEIHMIGGTTRDPRWLQLRADAYERPISVYSAAGALGAVLPGVLLNRFIPSSDEFLERYRVRLNRVAPSQLSPAAQTRKYGVLSWFAGQP
jgi:sugar (pentulose or hexulose) kinase